MHEPDKSCVGFFGGLALFRIGRRWRRVACIAYDAIHAVSCCLFCKNVAEISPMVARKSDFRTADKKLARRALYNAGYEEACISHCRDNVWSLHLGRSGLGFTYHAVVFLADLQFFHRSTFYHTCFSTDDTVKTDFNATIQRPGFFAGFFSDGLI